MTFLIVLWQGGYRFLYGQMSLGALITFNTYLNFLVWPMIALGLGDEYFPARRGVHGPLELHPAGPAAD